MEVTRQEIRLKVRALGLAGRAVCAHGSLRSFGHVEGGAEAVVDAFLDEGCTLLVPTFSSATPGVTHCGSAECGRCDDAVAGGPVVSEEEG